MCGRYTLAVPGDLVAEVFEAEWFGSGDQPHHEPRWNIAPTEAAPVVRVDRLGVRRLEPLTWGFRAFWDRRGGAPEGPASSKPSPGKPLINARSETVHEKAAFRSAFATRRCLVPADGFYEWRTDAPPPTARRSAKPIRSPLHFRRRDRGLFAMAGIWSPKAGDSPAAFAILTTTPNTLVEPIHDRMPVILPPESWAFWLDPTAPPEGLHSLLVPYPPEHMEVAPANRALNRAGREGPDLLTEELIDDGPGPLFA